MAFGTIDLQATGVAATHTFTGTNDLVISVLMANKGTSLATVTITLRGQTLVKDSPLPVGSSFSFDGLKLATFPTDVLSVVTNGEPVDVTVTTLIS